MRSKLLASISKYLMDEVSRSIDISVKQLGIAKVVIVRRGE